VGGGVGEKRSSGVKKQSEGEPRKMGLATCPCGNRKEKKKTYAEEKKGEKGSVAQGKYEKHPGRTKGVTGVHRKERQDWAEKELLTVKETGPCSGKVGRRKGSSATRIAKENAGRVVAPCPLDWNAGLRASMH